MTVDYRVGDVRDRLAEIPDGSVDLVTCSPPFLALRSYLPEGHESKHAEIGSEATPAEFLSTLLGLAREWRRILAPHGSIAIELGDTYAGSGGAGGDYAEGGMRDGQPKFKVRNDGGQYGRWPQGGTKHNVDVRPVKGAGRGWPLPKSLTGIPTLFAWSLAYGRNLLDPTDTLDPWRVRNVIVWARPNPAVGALGDKFRPATSYITVACPSDKRWFDLDSVRHTHSEPGAQRAQSKHGALSPWREGKTIVQNAAGAPPLDHWTDDPTDPDDGDLTWKLSTEGSSLSHYAMWPSTLAARLVDSMCPREVCRECGTPRRRMNVYTLDSWRSSDRPQTRRAVALADQHGLTEAHIAAVRAFGTSDVGKAKVVNSGAGKNTAEVQRLAAEAKAVLGGYFREFVMTTNCTPVSTWSDCGHDNYRPGLVLDPFAGTGTTLAAADFLGRDAIGIDLDARNAELYPLRRAEVERKLNPTVVAQVPGQLGLLDGLGA